MDRVSCLGTVHEKSGRPVRGWGRAVARWTGLLALVAATAGLSGCAAEVATEPAVAVPSDYYYYPYTYYDGHIVYFMNGSWYYPYGNRWYYYRHEPPELSSRTGSLRYYRPPYYRAPAAAPPYYRTPSPYGRGGGPPPHMGNPHGPHR